MGSREYPRLSRVEQYVAKIALKHPGAVVVSGGARGVDRAAETAAAKMGLGWVSYRPTESNAEPGSYVIVKHDHTLETIERFGSPTKEFAMDEFFSSYGRAAFERNNLIVLEADVVVAFHANASRGTAHSIRVAQSIGRPVYIYT